MLTRNKWIFSVVIVAIISFLMGVSTNFLHISSSSKILVQDDFDGAISNWYCSGDDGGSVVRDFSFYMSPNSSMRIVTPLGDNKIYYAERGTSRPTSEKFGLDFWWQVNSVAKNFEFTINWYYFENGTIRRYCASILYEVVGTNWEYLGSDGYYHSIVNGIQRLPIADTAIWIHAKLVVDFRTEEYVTFVSADKVFALSPTELPKLESFGNERIDWRFTVTNGNDAFSAIANVDDVKVTGEA